MKQRLATCPACAAPVEFRVSSTLVTVCEFCQSVVARSDKTVADHGKVADLVQTDSKLSRGQTGKFRGKSFEITGRVQYQHPAGGVWDEWYLAFPGNRVGWLAEAQGKFYLTTEKKLPHGDPLPGFDYIEVGTQLTLVKGKELTVAETGVATTGAAEGEIPWDFRPGIPHRFADLHGDDGAFATLDYSDEQPRLYQGREIQLKELDITGGMFLSDAPPLPNTPALQLSCPQCGGPLTLHVPDQSDRVGCPNCKSLLDCNKGKLEYLTTLKFAPESLRIPLGSVGKLHGAEYTVIGVMGRYTKWEGRTFPWTEYLLYNPDVGYRWLVDNDRHWSFVEPLSPSAAKEYRGRIDYNGKTFRIYDRGKAFVRYVLGEFYWKVRAGETAQTADYIAPPQMISVELSGGGDSKEVNVSLGTYLTVEEIEEAFKLDELRRPWGVGVIQPKPDHKPALLLGLAFCGVLVLLNMLISAVRTGPVDQSFFWLSLLAIGAFPIGILFYGHNFEVQRWKDSDYSPYATDD